jgi:hypothetical protein
MASGIDYQNGIDIRGVASEPVIEEIIFENKTVSEGLVAFETNIKAGTIFTENVNSVTMQPWSVNPTGNEDGTFGLAEVIITPVKVEYYSNFTPDDLRSSRFNRSMKPGAWNDFSDEFGKLVMNGTAKSIASDAESKFWNGATTATKSTVAGLINGTNNDEVGAEEQALVASMPTSLFDSAITRLIYNNSAVGGRNKIVGTTITASNIGDEYAKLYAGISPELLSATAEKAYIYAPRSHKQLINLFNIAQDFRDKFMVDAVADKYFYLGVEIKFVPVAENVLVVALPSQIKWCTDLMNDMNLINIDKYPAPRKDYFYDVVFTIFAHVINQRFITLYVG